MMSRAKPLFSSMTNQNDRQTKPDELIRYVYASDGVSLFLDPYLYSEEIAHIPFGKPIKLESLDYQSNFRYRWFTTLYQGIRTYVSEKWIGQFPVPVQEETIENYTDRLKRLKFDIDLKTYYWDDRQEFKILFPSDSMREIFLIASQLYPIDFKFPKESNKIEEIITKIDDNNDIYEEFEVTRNNNGAVIMLDYIADFGESSDTVTIRKRSDGTILLILGSYCQGYKKVNDI